MPNAAANRENCLLREIALDNEIAFAELFNLYRSKLYSFVFRVSGSRQVAEDVVQDVFMKIWQKRAQLNQVRDFNSYLFRIAYNHNLNAMKRMAKEKGIVSVISLQSNSGIEEAYGQLDYKELNRLLQLAVEELPKRQRVVFLLSKEQGMKQEEISRRLNISVVTVKSHMTQAYLSIRHNLKKACLFYLTYALLSTIKYLF